MRRSARGRVTRRAPATFPEGESAIPGTWAQGGVGRFTAMNLAGSAVPLIVAVVTVPSYLHIFGEVRYGVWLVAWVLVSYFGVVDLGLGRATANGVAKLRGSAAADRENLVWTGFVVNACFGVAIGTLVFGASEVAVRLIGLGGKVHTELVAALPWLAAALPLFIVATVLIGALEGLERFFIVNVVGTLGSVSIQGLPLAAGVLIAPRLDVLAAATTIALSLNVTLAGIACVIHVPMTMRPRFDRSQARGLLGFGAWITVTSLISPLLSTLDKVIIGAVSGARAVTHYTVPFNLTTRLWIFPMALARAVFPRFSRLGGADARALAGESSRALSAIITPIIVLAIVGVEPFMRAWVGRAFANVATLPAEILLLGLWVNSLGFIPYTYLQAQGRPDLPAKLHLLELLPFVGILWLGVKIFGVAGAAAAWSARVFVDTTLLLVLAKNKPQSQAYLVPGGMLVAAAFVLAQLAPPSVTGRALVSVALVPAVLVWSWIVAPPSLRRIALRLRPRLRVASTR